jgi:cell division protein FtsI/penicillin-binding protein 2
VAIYRTILHGLDDEDDRFLRDGMVEIVQNRSGQRAKIENLKTAGKTGTVQFFEYGEKRNLV